MHLALVYSLPCLLQKQAGHEYGLSHAPIIPHNKALMCQLLSATGYLQPLST